MLFATLLTFLAALLCPAAAVDLNIDDPASIRNASRSLAFGLQSFYQNNVSNTAATAIGTLPAPLYWWQAGAMWGSMVDYWAYTNDSSYNAVITQALLAQVGPDWNYMPPAYYASLGNDDQVQLAPFRSCLRQLLMNVTGFLGSFSPLSRRVWSSVSSRSKSLAMD